MFRISRESKFLSDPKQTFNMDRFNSDHQFWPYNNVIKFKSGNFEHDKQRETAG